MAYAYIIECEEQGKADRGHRVPVPMMPPVTTQRVTYTTSAQSAAFNGRTTLVGFRIPEAAHVAWGADPTATVSTPLFAAGTEFWFGVEPGSAQKIAFFDGTSS